MWFWQVRILKTTMTMKTITTMTAMAKIKVVKCFLVEGKYLVIKAKEVIKLPKK